MRILMIILGLIFGSLGSVILTRFSDGVTRKSLYGFFFGRSECPHCHHKLGIRDLVPLFSYLFQGGRCRYCGAKLSRIYPVLELLSAGIFLITYLVTLQFGRGVTFFWILTNRAFLLLLIYDIKTYELHMSVRYILTGLGIIGNIILPNGDLWNALLSTLLFTGVFLLIYFFAKAYVNIRFKQQGEGFGEGDIYLGFVIGLYIPLIFSFQQILFSGSMLIKILIIYILMSSIIGLIRSVIQYLVGKKYSAFGTLNSTSKTIPFFPAMIIAFRLLAWKSQYFITLIF